MFNKSNSFPKRFVICHQTLIGNKYFAKAPQTYIIQNAFFHLGMGKDKNVDDIQKTNKPRRQLWVQKQMSFRSNSIEAKKCENNELKILKDPSSSLMNNVVPNER